MENIPTFEEYVKLNESKIPHKGSAEYNQYKIAIDTIKNPTKGKFLGGPDFEEAKKILITKFGLSDADIKKLSGKH